MVGKAHCALFINAHATIHTAAQLRKPLVLLLDNNSGSSSSNNGKFIFN
jgi:hypothetical protein